MKIIYTYIWFVKNAVLFSVGHFVLNLYAFLLFVPEQIKYFNFRGGGETNNI